MAARKQAKQPQAKGAWKATTALAKNTMPKAKTKALDFTKPVRTCGGLPARIICTDSKEEGYPVVALVTLADGTEQLQTHALNGRCYLSGNASKDDLENYLEVTKYQKVPFRSSGWQSLHGDKLSAVCVDLDIAMTSDGVVTHVELSK